MRVRANMMGTPTRPRISVYRSSRYIYAQAIDDIGRKTIAAYSSFQIGKKQETLKEKKTVVAKLVGKKLAQMLLAQKITTGVFDRNVYAYQGRVKALANGLREGGIKI